MLNKIQQCYTPLKKRILYSTLVLGMIIYIYSLYFKADPTYLKSLWGRMPVANVYFLLLIIDAVILPTRLYVNASSLLGSKRYTISQLAEYYYQYTRMSVLAHLPLGSFSADIARIVTLKSSIFENISAKKKGLIIIYDKITGVIALAVYFVGAGAILYFNGEILLTIVGILFFMSLVCLYIQKKRIRNIWLFTRAFSLSLAGAYINIIIYYVAIKATVDPNIDYISLAFYVPLIIMSAVVPFNVLVGMKEITGYIFLLTLGADSITAVTIILIILLLDFGCKLSTLIFGFLVRRCGRYLGVMI